ncbi:MAG: cell division FtsA domain-containing protein, partial [Halanaerobiales bacterium]
MKSQGDLIFTLDIGTRTVVGLVIRYNNGIYEILASHVVEHEERAMLDGQIHNVNLVVKQVEKVKNKLEETLAIKLEKVAIAAAGRALKTVNVEDTLEFKEKRLITEEEIRRLEFSAIQKARSQLIEAGTESGIPQDFHFVGYSVREYELDGMYIQNLEGHQARHLKVKIVATFLPRVVVDSLLSVVNKAGLQVDYLTLEPIAAANLVIPRDMYNFNLALVDIGAGTSDIALTKAGSMFAYSMVPIAGDEITEAIAEHYLLDYNTGERVKRSLLAGEEIKVYNILSQETLIKPEEAFRLIEPVVHSLAAQISEAILNLNNKEPQAVLCIGGGSLTPNLLEGIAEYLGLPRERVGIKQYNDLKQVQGEIPDINPAQASTPIGIAVSAHENKGKAYFLNLTVNGNKYQLFTVNRGLVADALLAAGIDLREISGLPGRGITCTVNGELKVIRGELGEPGQVILNGQPANLETEIKNNDVIEVFPGTRGIDASGIIGDLVPELITYNIKINGESFLLKPEIYQNNLRVDRETPIIDGAEIRYDNFDTIRAVMAKLYDINPAELNNAYITYKINNEEKYIPQDEILVLVDNKPIDLDLPVDENVDYIVLTGTRKSFTIKDIMEAKLNNSIEIFFNGSILNIPTRGKLYCNGEEI